MAGNRQVSNETLEAIARMLQDGAAIREIARTLKVARQTINYHFPEYKGWTKQQNAEVSRAKRKFNSIMKSNGTGIVLE